MAAASELPETGRRIAEREEEQVAALAAREVAMAGELTAKDDGDAERHAKMERRLTERDQEHAATLSTRKSVAANEQITGSKEASY